MENLLKIGEVNEVNEIKEVKERDVSAPQTISDARLILRCFASFTSFTSSTSLLIIFCSRASRHRRGASRGARYVCRIFLRWEAGARRGRLRGRAARRRVRPRRATR